MTVSWGTVSSEEETRAKTEDSVSKNKEIQPYNTKMVSRHCGWVSQSSTDRISRDRLCWTNLKSIFWLDKSHYYHTEGDHRGFPKMEWEKNMFVGNSSTIKKNQDRGVLVSTLLLLAVTQELVYWRQDSVTASSHFQSQSMRTAPTQITSSRQTQKTMIKTYRGPNGDQHLLHRNEQKLFFLP